MDWNKTWVWCTQTSQRKRWKELAARHLHGQQPLFVNSSTDLGVVVNYGKSKTLLDIPKRLQQAHDRLERLYQMNPILSWHLFPLGVFSLLASILCWHLFSLGI